MSHPLPPSEPEIDHEDTEVTIIEEWDDAAQAKYDYHEKVGDCSTFLLLFIMITLVALILRAAIINGGIDSTMLIAGSRALMFVGAIGIFGSLGAGLYYQWRSNSIDSTITYKLEHPDETQEDITEREVAAISLGYDRDHFDDVPESEVPCPRCLEVHDSE